MKTPRRIELIGGEIVPMSPKGAFHEDVKRALARFWIKALPPEALVAPIAGGRAPVWYTLFGVHYHTAYHVGQIRLLRALQAL